MLVKKITRLFLAVILCVSTIFSVIQAPKAQAAVNWSKDANNPVFSRSVVAGAANVIYDSDESRYKMWYTHGTTDPDKLDSFIDDIDALVSSVLEDGKIDEEEHEMMLSFFGEFFKFSNQAVAMTSVKHSDTVSGICAVNPEVSLQERSFCFTGSSKREPRENIKKILNDLGGIFSEKLDYDIDYLVIGADGSPCWTYACYGRKVEEAIQWQKEGAEILVIHEDDFWKAVSAAK